MPLNDLQRQRLRQKAEERGVDADALIEAAENLQRQRDQGGQTSEAEPEATATAGRPTFDRLLIGAFPFLRVRELRSIWLGVDDAAPDDDLFTGEWLEKHGGAHVGGSSSTGDGGGDE